MATTPSDPAAPGPPVPGTELLLRVIFPGAARVWVPHGRLSSAAFHEPKFSVNIASIEDHAATLQRFGSDCGLAEFLCADALALGYEVCHEPENDNPAHAHVYARFGGNERKRKARSLADRARLAKRPIASP